MDAPLPPTLRVILCRQAQPANRHAEATHALVEATRAALVGGAREAGYINAGDDLELGCLDEAPAEAPEALLEQALHSLLVVLADRNLGDEAAYGAWLDRAYAAVKGSGGRHAILLIVSSGDVAADLLDSAPGLMAGAQAMEYALLGERAVRGAHLAIVVLNEARALLTAAAEARGLGRGLSSVFISHAKGDGLPLAMALRDHLKAIPHRGGRSDVFYDDSSLLMSQDWARDLDAGVASSLLLVVRTDAYDGRPYCQKEVQEAERHATPAVVVDARVGLCQQASRLPLGDLPTARIPDGNLIRALHLVLWEGLRAALLSARVAEMDARPDVLPDGASARVLYRAPTERSIRTLTAGVPEGERERCTYVFYPDPPLPAERHEVLEYLLRTRLPDAWLVTPSTYFYAAAAPARTAGSTS
jgi:hypothetical protein